MKSGRECSEQGTLMEPPFSPAPLSRVSGLLSPTAGHAGPVRRQVSASSPYAFGLWGPWGALLNAMTSKTWFRTLAPCRRLWTLHRPGQASAVHTAVHQFIHPSCANGRGSSGHRAKHYSCSPPGVSRAVFNSDFKAICQTPVYKSMAEMILMVSN